MNPISDRHATSTVNFTWIKQGNQPLGRGYRDVSTRPVGGSRNSPNTGLVTGMNIANYSPYIALGSVMVLLYLVFSNY